MTGLEIAIILSVWGFAALVVHSIARLDVA
ncbi:hypothetical protein METEAL_22190 [Mesoterricola silvestris]|uniref:Uncharacterized protein n=1 Tax=Mesoterricola silvestris TaxID=2927979 RepID=A0AA48GP13_9BACT|nr:hypothetical protein METEAL_22190 [Mesoterricola silvestris]